MRPVIFDLDGTLIDSVPDIHAAVARMLVREGVPVLDQAVVKSFVGNGLPTLVARVIDRCGMDAAHHPRLTAGLLQDYTETPQGLTTVYPGVVAALVGLQRAGHPLGICTNKPLAPALAILKTLGLAGHFGVVIGGDSLAVVKPDPAPLRATIAALGGGPAIFVGDSEVDAATARAAEVPFLLYTEGYRKSPVSALAPDAAFADFRDLAACVAVVI
jgi:phosphoglycolate phosphatase